MIGRFLFLAGLAMGTSGCRDANQPAWRPLTEDEFINVNCHDDTWSWEPDGLHCTGIPIGVIRTRKTYTNFELELEWMHQTAGGNSGLFIWTSHASILRLQSSENPGPPLPDGIEIQILDYAFKGQATARGEPTDWFTTHGDVFPVRAEMTPFPPVSQVPDQHAVYKDFGRGPFEIVGRKTPGRSFPSKEPSKRHGEWNHYRVLAKDGVVRLFVNGEEVSGGKDCRPATGYICFESEGAPIVFRNLRIRELP